jgi:hypothetical protein
VSITGAPKNSRGTWESYTKGGPVPALPLQYSPSDFLTFYFLRLRVLWYILGTKSHPLHAPSSGVSTMTRGPFINSLTDAPPCAAKHSTVLLLALMTTCDCRIIENNI